MIGLSVGETTLGTLVANLGYDKVMMPKPVFIGDTLRCETAVTELRQSRSRPHAGIVTFGHRLINQREEIVYRCQRMAPIQTETGKAQHRERVCQSEWITGEPG